MKQEQQRRAAAWDEYLAKSAGKGGFGDVPGLQFFCGLREALCEWRKITGGTVFIVLPKLTELSGV